MAGADVSSSAVVPYIYWEVCQQTYEMVEKRGTYLVIKQYHNKQVKGLIIAEILILFIFSCALLYIHSHKEDYTTNDSIAIIVVGLIIQTFLVYCLGFELKAYKVCDNGIYVKWFGLLCYLLEWGEIKYIRIEIVKQKSIENNSILVSKIPIKTNDYPRGINSYFSAVDNDWLALRPSKVIAIYIDEMNPDQYEEFWSYVPERLKKDSQKSGLYSKENCC